MLLYRKVLLCTTYDLLRWDSIFTCTFYSFIFLRCLLIIVKNDLQYIHGYCCEKLEEIKLKFCVFIRMSDIYKPYAHKKCELLLLILLHLCQFWHLSTQEFLMETLEVYFYLYDFEFYDEVMLHIACKIAVVICV